MAASLVVQTSFLGDTVLTTPLLVQLANRGAVDVVTTPASASLLAGHPAVREVIVYDKRGRDAGLFGFIGLVRRLRTSRYDAAYLAQGSVRSALLAALAGIPVRNGFATSGGAWLYTRRVAFREDLHHAARLLLLEQLALAADVAAVAFGQHVLAHRLHRLPRDDLGPDRRLDDHLEQLPRD